MSRVKSRTREAATSLTVVLAISLALGMTSAIASPPQGSIGDTVPGADPTCVQDVDGDGYVGFKDVVELLFDWGECPIVPPSKSPGFDDDSDKTSAETRECSRADVDGNGIVGIVDLLLVLQAYGFHCDRLDP